MEKILSNLRKISDYILLSLSSEKGYSALFKAGIVLLGLSLFALSQVGPFLYEKDLAAHKAKFTFETKFNQSLEDIDCVKSGELHVDCLVAQHEMKTFYSASELLVHIIKTSNKIGVSLMLLSLFGFLCNPFIKNKSLIHKKLN